ncbi:hypothetical protein MRX96_043085 [Rhipicephalus microplus]
MDVARRLLPRWLLLSKSQQKTKRRADFYSARERDPEQYKRLLRLHIEQFNHLLALIEPKIVRQDTVMRSLVPAKTRLQVTLRFLALGEPQFSLSHQFKLGHSTVNNIIPKTCATIYEQLHHTFFKNLKTEVEWQSIIEGFIEKWQFPNCCGTIDSKQACVHCKAKKICFSLFQ